MSNDKSGLAYSAPALLPTSSTSSPRHKAQVTRRLVFFSVLAFFAVHHLSTSSSASANNDKPADGIEAYWNGVASKGYRRVLGDDHAHAHAHPCPPRLPHHIDPKNAEEIFLKVPNNDSAHHASYLYTKNAHPAGSGFDFYTALLVKNQWERELGLPLSGVEEAIYDAGSAESQARIRGKDELGVWIDTYYPVMNTPVSSSVTLLSDPPVHAKLREEVVEGDPDSDQGDEVRVFHGLSVSGDVTGKYVYAGYGTKAEVELLEEKGIDLNGTIALVKYGRVFRGLKVKAAQEAGAIGCLIFTDPADDGEYTEANGYEAYPDGPARQPSSVQRGSVQFLSKYPGDPTTPGEPAYKNATRVPGGNFPDIPSLPLSYEDAIPILKALKGKGLAASELGPSFEGGLGFHGVEYFTGPSDIDLHLVNQVNTRVMPIWNTMAVIPGHISSEAVIMGNHRDAWVLGGSDPNAGTVAQYELVRGLGALLRTGWRPLRTIVLASWDAEEYGLIGSTEWAEDFGDWLEGNAAAYLNLDSAASGPNAKASASPSLALLIRQAAEEVVNARGKSVWDARRDGGDWDEFRLAALGVEPLAEAVKTESGISALGSGSDYTAFLMRYGVASSDFGFSGGPKDPVYHYHSIYDSHSWQDKFGDPGFHSHTDAAKIIGLILLRVADSVILPLNTTNYAADLVGYLDKIEQIKASADGTFDAVDLAPLAKSIRTLTAASLELDSTKSALLKKLHDALPRLPLWRRAALRIARALRAVFPASLDAPDAPDAYTLPRLPLPGKWKALRRILAEIRAVNLKLKNFERGFISEKGITDREWYRHKGTSPGKWLGYGATTFPALTEALTIEKNVTLAQNEADQLADMINAMATRLRA
ncbi:Vacuolar protein sorting-associated protein 70 [Cryptotrichosporon argae]